MSRKWISSPRRTRVCCRKWGGNMILRWRSSTKLTRKSWRATMPQSKPRKTLSEQLRQKSRRSSWRGRRWIWRPKSYRNCRPNRLMEHLKSRLSQGTSMRRRQGHPWDLIIMFWVRKRQPIFTSPRRKSQRLYQLRMTSWVLQWLHLLRQLHRDHLPLDNQWKWVAGSPTISNRLVP